MKNKKKNKNSGFLLKLLKFICLIINIIVATLLFLVFLAQFIRPSFSTFPSYMSLIFNYLLFANLFFVLFWLFIKTKYVLISISALLLNINNIDRSFQLKATEKPTTCVKCVKVMSYNVKLFGLYDSEDSEIRNQKKSEIFSFIRDEKPDILCLQEYFYDKSGKLNFVTTDSLISIMNIDGNRFYYQYFPTNRNNEFFYGYATFSKYKIVNKGFVTNLDSTITVATFIDIKYRGDTVRVYNVHLSSVHLDDNDYEVGKNFAENQLDDPKFNLKAKKIISKLGIAFQNRQSDALALHAHIKACDYPIVLCGDLNDSPTSFAYRKINGNLKDSFRQSGEGSGVTYFGSAFPSFRIDYITHDKRYKSFGFQVHDSLTVSDHYPISTFVSLYK